MQDVEAVLLVDVMCFEMSEKILTLRSSKYFQQAYQLCFY